MFELLGKGYTEWLTDLYWFFSVLIPFAAHTDNTTAEKEEAGEQDGSADGSTYNSPQLT